MAEIIADSGDVFVVRACDDDEGCTVIERFLTKHPEPGKERAQDEEPVQCIDIPRDVLGAIVKHLQGHAWCMDEEVPRG